MPVHRIAVLALFGALTAKSLLGAPAAGATGANSATAGAAAESPWDISTTLRGSVGWRENVTVSAIHRIDRSFYRGEAELFVVRPFGTRWELLSFIDGDVLRYFSPPPGIAGEQQWVGHIEGRWVPLPSLRLSLKTVGFIEDTFLDPSQTEGSLQPAIHVRLRGGYATFAPRVSLPWHLAVEPSLQVKRVRYRDYAGDYDEVRPGAALEWKRSDRLVLSAGWYDHTRHYSQLLATRPGGRPILGSLLTIHEREGELKGSSGFDAAGHWTITATANRLEHRDRAFGNLDYNQERGELEVNWRRNRWRIALTGDARRIDYLFQKAGAGLVTELPARIADIYEASGRVERELTARWTLFAEYRWERNRSNLDFSDDLPYRFSYRTSIVQLGAQRTF